MDRMTRREYAAETERSRAERMQWWNEARFGMFVHWGTYAVLGRHEWVMGMECIPKDEYEALADRFAPPEGAPRQWAALAKEAGMKYMVMTTKHHEGFCLWDTGQTDYNAVKRGPKRDLVAEYVEACREFDLGVGFYYSLMDWNHPDGGRCLYDPAARRRFVEFTHGCVRELMSDYGKIDILWYDVPRPLANAEGWESDAMNQMVRSLQPHILINNRSRLPEDFSTPEGRVTPEGGGRGWEACMTFNDTSWGYMPSAAADGWEARDILKMLNTAAGGQGNLLLNIGPAPDGSVPYEAVEPLQTVGKWLQENGEAVYGQVDRAGYRPSACGRCSRKGSTVYFWCRCWPGSEMALGGFGTKLESARFLHGGEPIDFEQEEWRIVLRNLPQESPDKHAGVTVIELQFAEPPTYRHCATVPAMTAS